MTLAIQNRFEILPPELINIVMGFLSPEECAKCGIAYKNFLSIAEKNGKKKLVNSFKESIQRKAENFLKMVPGQLEEFCPKFALNLKRIDESQGSLSTKKVYEQLNCLTEKYPVSIREISDADHLSPEEIDRCGLQFMRLTYRLTSSKDPNYKNGGIHLWGELPSMNMIEVKSLFPLKLFNLNSHHFPQHICFPLKGRLIELVLENSPEEIKKTQIAITYPEMIYSPTRDAFPDPNEPGWKRKTLQLLKDKGLASPS